MAGTWVLPNTAIQPVSLYSISMALPARAWIVPQMKESCGNKASDSFQLSGRGTGFQTTNPIAAWWIGQRM
jgi:hypothetical protein